MKPQGVKIAMQGLFTLIIMPSIYNHIISLIITKAGNLIAMICYLPHNYHKLSLKFIH